jgi:5-methylcytosine-specific restriction enzyme A
VLTAKQIWPILQSFMPKDQWMTPMDIYEVVRKHSDLDARDLEPIVAGTAVPNPQLRWGSNVRGVLRTRFKSGELEWDEQGKYRLPTQPALTSADPSEPVLTLDFVPGQFYRRRSLHDRFGGQNQGGISTPARFPIILIFTGSSGKQHGYSDGWVSDITFQYYGEGQVGDQRFIKGNSAIRDHLINSKTLLIFETTKTPDVKFVGEMIYTGHHITDAPDNNGDIRKAIVFELVLTESLNDKDGVNNKQDSQLPSDLEGLRAAALADSAESRTSTTRLTNTRRRSEAVKRYARSRANGICEGCESEAPFVTSGGDPYLEVHHVHRLSDGGPDRPDAVIAICPNCHRRVHHGEDGTDYNEMLTHKALAAEYPE